MAESVPDHPYEATHRIGHEGFFLDVYRLLSHVLASAELAALEDGSSQRPLAAFVTAHEKPEISRLLVSIAASYRIKFDDGSWEHGFWLHRDASTVGTLVENVDAPENEKALTFREACNKIIHAQRVHFDTASHPVTQAQFLNPMVHLYGSKAGSSWKSSLHLVQFCRAAANVIV
ncbi:MAG: hypothetical protein M3P06_16265 [Acidobacteriota bacterium]|nr:hypothetical protein [Acidobacteriota bacterium]